LLCNDFAMTRSYTQKRRAENQAQTRRRIVEATVDLHTRIGPARTTISAVAEQAGVQRHTVYAHFPTERELYLACSGATLERDPLPDDQAWLLVSDPAERLHRGLTELYGWYARNAELVAKVLRDAGVHAPTRDIVDMRIGARLEACRRALSRGLPATSRRQAAIRLALSFHTFQTLVGEGGVSVPTAVGLMAHAITSPDG
jgi:AcrR family transcriptional regulator